MPSLEELANNLALPFRDLRLLRGALLHRSFVNERPEEADGLPSNERLEFLGDAVLNMISAALLYERFPQLGEGELTTLRASLVKTATLAGFAQQLRLGHYAMISMGPQTAQARQQPALLADLFEALLGAIYLDGGLETARSFVTPLLERALGEQAPDDYKTLLQELVQAQRGITPRYETIGVSGPDHRREYTVVVLIGDQQHGLGRGTSKQAAAQQAALQTLQSFQNSPPTNTEQNG